MTYFLWRFEGQNPGDPVNIATSDDFGDPAWSSVNIASMITYSNAQAMEGTGSIKIDSTTTPATAIQVSKTDTASADVAISDYIYLTSYPDTATISFCGARGGASNLSRLSMTTTGQLLHQVGTTVGTASTPVLSLNTWYRYDFLATAHNTGSTVASTDIFLGHNTGTPVFSVPGVTASTANLVDEVRRAKFAGTAATVFYLDLCQQDIGRNTKIGRWNPPPATMRAAANLWSPAAALMAANR